MFRWCRSDLAKNGSALIDSVRHWFRYYKTADGALCPARALYGSDCELCLSLQGNPRTSLLLMALFVTRYSYDACGASCTYVHSVFVCFSVANVVCTRCVCAYDIAVRLRGCPEDSCQLAWAGDRTNRLQRS